LPHEISSHFIGAGGILFTQAMYWLLNGLRSGSTRRHHSHIPHKPALPGAVYKSLQPGQEGLLVCG